MDIHDSSFLEEYLTNVLLSYLCSRYDGFNKDVEGQSVLISDIIDFMEWFKNYRAMDRDDHGYFKSIPYGLIDGVYDIVVGVLSKYE